MVRTYVRKSDRAEISEDNILMALRDIKNGNGSIRAVASRYGLKKSMLHKRLKKINESNAVDIDIPVRNFNSKYVSQQVFTKEEEATLENYLIRSSKLQYGLSYYQVRQFAYEYAVRLEKRMPTSWQETKIAGLDWLKGFMNRHKNLSLRKPESTSLARNISFNKTNVDMFFNNLERVYEKYKFSSNRVVNVDESGVNTVLQMPKIVASKGSKQVGQAVGAERGEQVTFCGIIIANGNAIPPVYIFPRVRFKEAFLTGAPEGSVGIASQSGWMTNDGFVEVMKHVKKYTNASKENPVLVLLDNHNTHATLDLILYCRENGLVLLTFPPHTTHRLQPLDVCVFGPFKTRCKASFNSWMANHPGKAITIYDIANLTATPFNEAFSRQNILSGFKKTGCYPFNRNVFTADDFVGSQVTECDGITAVSSQEPNISNYNEEHDTSIERDVKVEAAIVPVNGVEVSSTNTAEAVASTSNSKINIISCITLTSPSLTGSNSFVNKPLPEEIRPYPKSIRPKTNKRKKKYSAILTETPEKEKLESEQKERENRKRQIGQNQTERKKRKQQKSHIRKVFADETSESGNDETLCQESDDSPMEEDEQENIDYDTSNLVENDFVLVRFATKKTIKYFVGQISSKISDYEFFVNFLKMAPGQRFIFPDKEDTSSISPKDIILRLPPPIKKAGTSRSNSFYKFCINFENYNMG